MRAQLWKSEQRFSLGSPHFISSKHPDKLPRHHTSARSGNIFPGKHAAQRLVYSSRRHPRTHYFANISSSFRRHHASAAYRRHFWAIFNDKPPQPCLRLDISSICAFSGSVTCLHLLSIPVQPNKLLGHHASAPRWNAAPKGDTFQIRRHTFVKRLRVPATVSTG
jgi:hypothetical protein